jgi:hypothetical protein
MQFSSGVMQVVHDYFENGYAQFKSSTFSPIANSTQYHFLH